MEVVIGASSRAPACVVSGFRPNVRDRQAAGVGYCVRGIDLRGIISP